MSFIETSSPLANYIIFPRSHDKPLFGLEILARGTMIKPLFGLEILDQGAMIKPLFGLEIIDRVAMIESL